MNESRRSRRIVRCIMIVFCAALAVSGAVYLVSRPEPRGTVTFYRPDGHSIECYRDGELLWTQSFAEDYVDGGVYTSNGAAVWGTGKLTLEDLGWRPWLARVDDSGNVLWQKWLRHGFEDEYIADVVEDADGSWAVISRGDMECLCLSRYYTITDMIEFGGKAYLSAYATPELHEWEPYHGGQAETIRVTDEIFSRDSWKISDNELTELLRKNYAALLFVYDPTDGSYEIFRSVDESLGGSLAVNARGELEWNTERVVTSRFSPMTSSFTLAGECEVTRHTFDIDGVQLGRENTGERTTYFR